MQKVEIIAKLELASNFFKEYEEREIRRQENKKFEQNQTPESFTNSTLNEVKIIVEALERGINNDLKKVFKVTEDDLLGQEFQEVRNLRILKFIKKIRMSLISLSIMEFLKQNDKTVFSSLF